MTNSQPHTIRRATRDDVAAIVRLLADDMLGSQREAYQDPLPVAYYQAFEAIDQDPNNELVVLDVDGEIAATLQLTFLRYLTFQGGKRAQIEAVRVDQRFRGLGLGSILFNWAIDHARQEGCRILQLTTNKQRVDAQRFYERLGFVASHEGMKIDFMQA